MDLVKCERCGASVPAWDLTHLADLQEQQDLCTRCFNAEIAELSGLDGFEDPGFEPVTLHDRHKREHTFHFRSRLVPTGYGIEAFELIDGEPGGYRFAVLDDLETDPLDLYRKLYERMRRAMQIDHLARGDDSLGLRYPGMIRGRVEWDRNTDDPATEPEVIIDGESFSWQAFGRMLMSFEGWSFRLEMVDETDEEYVEPRRPPQRG